MRIKYWTGYGVDYADAYRTPREAVDAEWPEDADTDYIIPEPKHEEMGVVSALDAEGNRWWGIVPKGFGIDAHRETAQFADAWWDEDWDDEVEE